MQSVAEVPIKHNFDIPKFNQYTRIHIAYTFKTSVKKCVHKRGFSNSSFTDAKNVKTKALAGGFVDKLIWKTIKTYMSSKI